MRFVINLRKSRHGTVWRRLEMICLRPYQAEAVEAVYNHLRTKDNNLGHYISTLKNSKSETYSVTYKDV